jgi:hypothetical protein
VNVVDVVVEGITIVLVEVLRVVDVVGLMLGLFPRVAGVFSEFPGPVVVVVVDSVVDVDVVVASVLTQFLLLVTWAQLGAATAVTAETAIAAAKTAATVRSTSIRLTLHLPFLYSFFPTQISYRSDSATSAAGLTSSIPLPPQQSKTSLHRLLLRRV